ncbi:MAG: cyanophycinase [Bacteroidetes bacterium]|nr:cyanophycinase [Bacteroidota bacterium]
MQKQIPKGKLLLIGGAEDKGKSTIVDIEGKNKQFEEFEILKGLLPEKKGKRILEIITTASQEPKEVMKTYQRAFKEIGFNHIGFISMENNPQARNPLWIKRINNAHAVLFAGGDQFRLSTILGNTDIIDVIMERYYKDPDFIVAGTSAGAMAAASLMIYEGQRNEAMLKNTVKVSSGLGFIDHCIIDTHFVKRGRFGRLVEALLMNPSCIGIGLGEDTALVIRKGNEAECKGSGMVVILDGRDISETNIAYAEPGTPLWAENLRVHILTKGNYFLLHERKFAASKKQLNKEKIGSKIIDKVKPDKIIIENGKKITKKKPKKAAKKRVKK